MSDQETYDKLRAENIARNNAILNQLGLNDIKLKEPRKNKKRKISQAEFPVEKKSSPRLSKKPKAVYNEISRKRLIEGRLDWNQRAARENYEVSKTNYKIVYIVTGPKLPHSWTKKMKNLGVLETEELADATHLVINSNKLVTSIKLFCAVSLCNFIVNSQWIEACIYSKFIVDEERFAMQDLEYEKQFGCDLQYSLKNQNPLLFNEFKFFVTKNCFPGPSQIEEIVKCSHGRVLRRLPPEQDFDSYIVICCEQDIDFIEDKLKNFPKNQILTPEWILQSTISQNLQKKNSFYVFEDTEKIAQNDKEIKDKKEANNKKVNEKENQNENEVNKMEYKNKEETKTVMTLVDSQDIRKN